jgi:serpin B
MPAQRSRKNLLVASAALAFVAACGSGESSRFAGFSASPSASTPPWSSAPDRNDASTACGALSAPRPSSPRPDVDAAPAPPAPICSAPQGDTGAATQLVASDTAFGVALYGKVASTVTAGQNIILSPYSASASLTMLDVGAAGETDTQIRTVLHLPGNGATVAPAWVSVACQDETDGSYAGNHLSIADAVWGQQGVAFEPTFLSVLATGFGAPLQQVDFLGDPSAAASAINQWIGQQTLGTIPAALQPGDLDQMTRIVLVNAIAFKGTWDTGFQPSQTTARIFTLSDGTRALVPTMSGNVNLGIGYSSAGSPTVYELTYASGALAMDFLVPAGSLSALEASLTADSLSAALGSIAPASEQTFYLPRFSFTTRLALDPLLSAMGMPDVFVPHTANLSGIDGATDLSVSHVIQQAFVAVDEQGTTAAAATVVTGGCFSLAVNPLAVDRPFLFLIRDRNNGSILFVGRVEDPRQVQ